jgi:hypothetical protein
MEPFDIKVDHNGQTHDIHVVPHEEDPVFELQQGGIDLGKIRNECDDRGDYWCSEDLIDAEFLQKIGERIEKYER